MEAKGDPRSRKGPMMAGFELLAATAGPVVQNVSTLDPASPPAESIRFLMIFVTAVGAFILAVVWGVLFYSLLRFRRKKSAADTEPPQVYGSMPIEIAWTVAPAIIVVLLTLVIVRTEIDVRRKPSTSTGASPLEATVIGHQWWWEYVIERDGERKVGVVTANELHVPASQESGVRSQGSAAAAPGSAGGSADARTEARPIYLTLKSADVCHSFWVPRLAGKTDLIPGRINEMWFQTDKPGLYLGQCAEYCGAQHAGMLLSVYVDPREEFESWLANEEKPAVDDGAAREGKAAFLAQSCVNCHTVRGTMAHGKVGPDLTHLAARHTIGGGMIELNRDNLRDWIHDPQQLKPGCLMPAFGLSDRNLELITDYLMTLK
jgi:cytochrome c oxidase subunit 2